MNKPKITKGIKNKIDLRVLHCLLIEFIRVFSKSLKIIMSLSVLNL
jgi:hypothetical protein